MRKVLFIVVGALAAFSFLPAASARASSGSIASFEGQSIDLTRGWGEATACAAFADTTTCFRTEAAMRRWLAETRPTTELLSSCSSSVDLYEHGGFGGAVLGLYAQGAWINLATYGFNDKTSSYAVGGCDSYFAEHTDGNGNWYPGNTSAWASSGVMASGWNDRISSVWIS